MRVWGLSVLGFSWPSACSISNTQTNIAESAEDSIPAYVASCAFFFALCRLELSKPTITYYRGLNSYQYYFFGGVFLIMIIVYVMGPKP